MQTSYLEEYQKITQTREKNLDSLIHSFISEFDLSNTQKNQIYYLLDQLKSYSLITYIHSAYVAFRTYDLAITYLNKDDTYYTLNKNEFRDICVASILHDVGKMSIPLSILEKPGPLTSQEFSIVQTHTLKAKEYLEGFPESVIDLVIHHHEKLDGSGYPNHLKGQQINLGTRILTIADITSALSQKRSYKNILRPCEVAEILLRYAIQGKVDSIVCIDMIKILLDYETIKYDNQEELEIFS